MTRKGSYDDDEDDADHPEDPDPADMDDDGEDGPDVVECPRCGAEFLEEAGRCPRCGNYLSEEDAPRRKPTWVVVTAAVLVVAILACWVVWGG